MIDASNGNDSIIDFVVRKLEIMLTLPESEVVKQYESPTINDQDTRMYYIAKGEFTVYVQTQPQMKSLKVRSLALGDHFGEISMIYNCKRTATVTSNKYATLGYLSKCDYKKILFKYQEVSFICFIYKI